MKTTLLAPLMLLGISTSVVAQPADYSQMLKHFPEYRAYPYKSANGLLSIGISQSCVDYYPRALYQERNGPGGFIEDNKPCQDVNPIKFNYQYKFKDLSGDKRCMGRVSFQKSKPEGYNTTWYIDGSYPGYQCSTVGKVFRVNNIIFDSRRWEPY